MSYQIVKSTGSEYAVDWDIVERFCMSYWLTYYQLVYSDTIRMSESTWYNPFSWSLPAIQTIEVDWNRVRDAARSACASDVFNYSQNAARDMRGVALEVKWKLEQTGVNRKKFTTMLKDVQSANIGEMERAESDYTGMIDAARFVRDTSADIVAIGSTVATGGASVGLIGASSAMKGVGKYQDTGKAGSAMLYGGGSMVLGAFKVGGAKLTTAGEYTLIICQGILESGTSLAAGDNFGKAVEKGGLKVASAGAAQALFGNKWVKTVFSKIPIPFNVFSVTSRDGPNVMETDIANQLLEKTSKKMTEKGSKAALSAGVAPLTRTRSGPAQARAVAAGLIDEVPIEEMLLLQCAIVHMGKGIGRGW